MLSKIDNSEGAPLWIIQEASDYLITVTLNGDLKFYDKKALSIVKTYNPCKEDNQTARILTTLFVEPSDFYIGCESGEFIVANITGD